MELSKELQNNNIILTIFRKEYYNESVFEIIRSLEGKTICYVTLNKPASSLINAFRFHKILVDNLFFLDAVSVGIGKAGDETNVLHISSPSALTEMGIALSECIKAGNFDVLLFDSLSTLSIYKLGSRSEKFISNIIGKLKANNIYGIFTALEEDTSTDLIKDTCMNVDQVITLEKFYHTLDLKKTRTAFVMLFSALVLSGFVIYFSLPGITSLTGMAIIESDSNSVVLLFMAVLAVFFGIIVYKTAVIEVVPHEKLIQIKPAKHDPREVRERVRQKLSGWISKIKR